MRRVRKGFVHTLGLDRLDRVHDDVESMVCECVAKKKRGDCFDDVRETLIHRFVPLSMSIVSNYVLGHRDMSEDLRGEAWLSLVRAIDRLIDYEGHPNIPAYLYLNVNGSILRYLSREKDLGGSTVGFDFSMDDGLVRDDDSFQAMDKVHSVMEINSCYSDLSTLYFEDVRELLSSHRNFFGG